MLTMCYTVKKWQMITRVRLNQSNLEDGWEKRFCCNTATVSLQCSITHIPEQLTPKGTHAEGLIGWSGAWKAYSMNGN